jgi:hypothetical protein
MRLLSTRGAQVVLGVAIAAAFALTGAGIYLLTQSPAQNASVNLVIQRNVVTGTYGYAVTSVFVPHARQVDFTITNWDPQSHSVMPQYLVVSGTMDEMTVYMHGGMMGGTQGQMMGSLTAGQISHTFTMMTGGYSLNIPVPAAPDSSTPSVLTFTMLVNGPMSLEWGCMANGMGDPGAMTGTFVVN